MQRYISGKQISISRLLKLRHLHNVLLHGLVLGLVLYLLPGVPLGPSLGIEYSRAARLRFPDGGHLEETVEDELILVGGGLWQRERILGGLVEIFLQSHGACRGNKNFARPLRTKTLGKQNKTKPKQTKSKAKKISSQRGR
jgi:hypothetical protein